MVSESQQLMIAFDYMRYILNKLSWASIVLLITAPFLYLCFFYTLIVSPLICHLLIVPKIEKKVGKKLSSCFLSKYRPFGNYLSRQNEISRYIVDIYYAYKKFGKTGLPEGYYNFSLKQVGYTIAMVSKVELIFAFSIRIQMYIGTVSFIIAFLAAFMMQYA